MNFKENVKRICKEKGLLQKDLADRLGITYIGLNKSLRGNYPQLQTLERIASVLNVPVSELFEQPSTDIINCPYCGGKIKVSKSEMVEVMPKVNRFPVSPNVMTLENHKNPSNPV